MMAPRPRFSLIVLLVCAGVGAFSPQPAQAETATGGTLRVERRAGSATVDARSEAAEVQAPAGSATEVERTPSGHAQVPAADARQLIERRQADTRLLPERPAAPAGTETARDAALLARGWERYRAGAFEEASAIFATVPPGTEHFHAGRYGLASCYLAQGETARALPLLEELVLARYRLPETLPQLLQLLAAAGDERRAGRYVRLVGDDGKLAGHKERSATALFLKRYLAARNARDPATMAAFLHSSATELRECRQPALLQAAAASLVGTAEAPVALQSYRTLLACTREPGSRVGLFYALKPLLPPEELLTLCDEELQRPELPDALRAQLEGLALECEYARLAAEPERTLERTAAILARHPGDRIALAARGWWQLRSRNYPEAYQDFAAIEPGGEGEVERVTGLVYALSGQGRYQEALALIAAHPAEPAVAALEGTVRREALWDQVNHLAPDAPELPELAAQLLALDPGDQAIRRMRGWWFYNHGDDQSARNDFAELYYADPKGEDHAFGLASALLRLERFEEAGAVAKRQATEDPRLIPLAQRILLAQAESAYRAGRYDEAQKASDQLLIDDPEDAVAQRLNAASRFRQTTAGEVLPSLRGAPGFLWSSVTQDLGGGRGAGGYLLLNQGIDWLSLPGGLVLNSYGEIRYNPRQEGSRYFDERGGAVGLVVKNSLLRFGFEYAAEDERGRDKTITGGKALLTWYYERPAGAAALPCWTLASYGRMTRDFRNLTGLTLSGYLNLGLDLAELPQEVRLNSYAEYRVNLRSRDNDYYNAHGPALGIELRRHNLRLGADYYWERLPEARINDQRGTLYLRWYYDWNLLPQP